MTIRTMPAEEMTVEAISRRRLVGSVDQAMRNEREMMRRMEKTRRMTGGYLGPRGRGGDGGVVTIWSGAALVWEARKR